ncbi:hypothetical protein GGI12_002076 [Dipsacomyces acuminosporus]|nr:hypothetical protein GGI12_002076 [Dipsacomyces acuminosporus]
MPSAKSSLPDGSEALLPGHTAKASLVATTSANKPGAAAVHTPTAYSLLNGEKETRGDDEEEVLGGGSIAVNTNHNISGSIGALNGAGFGNPQQAVLGSIAAQSPTGALQSDGGDNELPQTPSLAAFIPPSLQNSTVYDALLANGDASLTGAFDKPHAHSDSGGNSISSDGSVPAINDSWPISSLEDYSAVCVEAKKHWRARLKQPTRAIEQSKADIRDFMCGSPRRRLRLVFVQLHHLIDETPKIYHILEQKQIVQGPAPTLTRLDRSLNALWSDLKLRCSLLILDKDSAQAVVSQSPLNEEGECSDKMTFVRSLVAATVKDAFENTSLLWESFDAYVRALVLVGSSKDLLDCVSQAVQGSAGAVQNFVKVLLDVYGALPDIYKGVIRVAVETVASRSALCARVVVAELGRYRLLPGVLFRTIAECAGSADETKVFLDGLLCTGAAAWIGKTTSESRPAYYQVASEIRTRIRSHFEHLDEEMQWQHVLPTMRVLSGLTGYLRIEAQSDDYEFFKQAAKLIDSGESDTNAMDVCAALLLTLTGFGSQVTARDTLQAITGISATGTARRIDCLLTYLQSNRPEEVEMFVSRTLNMDFVFPRERLFYLKDITSQSASAYFSSANVARRLVRIVVSPQRSVAVSSPNSELCRAAILNLLQRGVFQNEGVDVREWFTLAVRSVSISTADQFGPLVKAYVNAIFTSTAVTPIPESVLWKAFTPDADGINHSHNAPPSQVLFLMYVLYYCERLLDQPKKIGSNGAFASFGKRTSLGQNLASGALQSRSNSPFGLSGGISSSGASSNTNSPVPNRTSTGRSSPFGNGYGAPRRGEYSDQLLDSLPVSWVVQHVTNGLEYQQISPELLSMATSQYPDQLEVVSVLQRELAANGIQDTPSHPAFGIGHSQKPLLSMHSVTSANAFMHMTRKARHFIQSSLASQAGAIQEEHLLHFVEEYSKYPVSVCMDTCEAFTTAICQLAIARAKEGELTAVARRAWYMVHALNPHAVSAATVNAWRTESGANRPRLVTQDIWLDPLVIFRSDTRLFLSRNLVDIWLTVLAEFLILSKTNMQRLFKLRQRDSGTLKHSHIAAMVQLQEAGAIQLLLELSRLVKDRGVKQLLFGFIHARFLEQRTIQKLIHFQAYDISAIRDMVEHVPSMHACSEFIPELLMQSSPRLQHFAIELAAAITSKYPIVANEGMAKEVILPHIQTTLTQIAGTSVPDQLVICNAMLRAVITINSAFPMIHEDCVKLLKSVHDVANDRARGMFQNTPQQQQQQQQQGGSDKPSQTGSQAMKQSIAKWVVCCERILSFTDTPKQTSATKADATYIPIEEVDAADMVNKLEAASKSEKKGYQGSGRSGSPVPSAVGSPPQQQPPQLSQSQQQQQHKSPRPPMPSALPPLHNDHQPNSQHQPQQQSASSAMQKRPHSSISSGAHPPRGSPPALDPALNGSMMPSRPSMPLQHMSDHSSSGSAGGGGPGGNKKRNKHRGRYPGKDGGGGGGSGGSKPGQGPKRSKNDRPRSKDR